MPPTHKPTSQGGFLSSKPSANPSVLAVRKNISDLSELNDFESSLIESGLSLECVLTLRDRYSQSFIRSIFDFEGGMRMLIFLSGIEFVTDMTDSVLLAILPLTNWRSRIEFLANNEKMKPLLHLGLTITYIVKILCKKDRDARINRLIELSRDEGFLKLSLSTKALFDLIISPHWETLLTWITDSKNYSHFSKKNFTPAMLLKIARRNGLNARLDYLGKEGYDYFSKYGFKPSEMATIISQADFVAKLAYLKSKVGMEALLARKFTPQLITLVMELGVWRGMFEKLRMLNRQGPMAISSPKLIALLKKSGRVHLIGNILRHETMPKENLK